MYMMFWKKIGRNSKELFIFEIELKSELFLPSKTLPLNDFIVGLLISF